MKKFFLLAAICAPFLLFTQCKESKDSKDFTLDATIAGTPVRAYLTYMKDGNPVIDSVDVVDNKFQFTGIAEEPFVAWIGLSHDAETFYSPRGMDDMKQLYIESGKIIITSDNMLRNATIAGSAINTDHERYSELTKDVNEELKANLTRFYSMTPEEQEENRESIIEADGALKEKKKGIAETFINENPDSWYAIKVLFNEVAPYNDADASQALLDKFTPRVKETQTAKDIQDRINAMRATAIGVVAPDFTLNNVEGNPVNLSDFRGQWVLVDFWASWCGPCRNENPHVVTAFEQFKDKNFTVLGVSLDDNRDAWIKAIEDDKLAWTQVSDLKKWNSEMVKLYAITGIPSNFLVNPEGVITEKDLRGDALAEALVKHLGE